MLMTVVAFGFVAALTVPGWCCRPKEYETSDGECCPMCHEGRFVQKDCTAQSGTRCKPCDGGTFMNQTNALRSCFPCTFCDPDQGLFAKQACTATSDTVCDASGGYYCTSFSDDGGCSVTEKHTACTAGQRTKEPGTSRNNTVCEACQPGTFSQDGLTCKAWTVCSETPLSEEGTSSRDVVCGAASRNRYTYIPVLLSLVTVGGLVITGRLKKSPVQEN